MYGSSIGQIGGCRLTLGVIGAGIRFRIHCGRGLFGEFSRAQVPSVPTCAWGKVGKSIMVRKLQAAVWGCVLGIATVGTSAAEIQLIPVGASGVHTITGNEIELTGANQRVELEIFISGWDPDQDGDPHLKSWEVDIDSSSYSSGVLGVLVPPAILCLTQNDPDEFCRSNFGGVCSLSGVPCVDDTPCTFGPTDLCQGSVCAARVLSEDCEPAFIHTGRTDYIFRGTNDLPAVDSSSSSFRFASTIFDGSGIQDPGTPKYAGTFFLDVPTVANGTFTITMLPSTRSVLRDDANELIEPVTLTPARITVACSTAQDCDDGDACTNDSCPASGFCRSRPNFDPATECCDPTSGRVCSPSSAIPGDVDSSGTVDLEDVAWMQMCFGASPLAPICAPLDLVCDCKIKLDDHAEFDALLTGP